MKKIAILVLVVIIIGLVYSNSLFNSFIWDDFLVIVDNNFIKSWKNFPLVFTDSYLSPFVKKGCCFFVDASSGSGETSYRPVVTLSYFLDYSLWKLNPFGYHLTSLILHMINALLVYFLANLLIKNRQAALLGALLFALHPVNSEAVNVIAFREDLLAFLFYLFSFLLYLKSNSGGQGRNLWLYLLSLASFFLALFSKETAVTLPLVIILYDCYFSGGGREILVRFKQRYLGYFGVLFFYIWVRFFLITNTTEPALGYLGGSFYTNFLTMSRVAGEYIKWMIFPAGISAIPSNQSYLVSGSLFSPAVLFSVALIIASFAVIIKTYKSSKEISFFMLWFFLALLPVSNIVPIPNYIASRYLYLPAAGFCFLVAVLLNKTAALRVFSSGLAIIILISYSGIAFISNFTWRNNLVFYSKMAREFPENALAHLDLGDAFKKRGLPDRAISEYKTAISLNPALVEAYNNLGATLGDTGRHKEAIECFMQGLEIAPDYLKLYDNLAVTYTRIKEWGQARKSWEKTLQIDPQYKTAIENLRKLKEWGY